MPLCYALAYAIAANGVCLHLLVQTLHSSGSSLLLTEHNSTHCSINRWVYFTEKIILWNNFIHKRGVGLFWGGYTTSCIIIFSISIEQLVTRQIETLIMAHPLCGLDDHECDLSSLVEFQFNGHVFHTCRGGRITPRGKSSVYLHCRQVEFLWCT